jgi:outer membrane protein
MEDVLMKRCAITFAILISVSGALFAQQLTRFAVIDLTRVYSVFFRDSRAVRDLEERSNRINAEIERMTEDIKNLQNKRVEALSAGDEPKALELESTIYKKSEFLKEYYRVKTAEIQDQKAKLSQSNEFLQQVLTEIKFVAESEGYSMVLNKNENAGIIWFSPTVDITETVIQNLMNKARR